MHSVRRWPCGDNKNSGAQQVKEQARGLQDTLVQPSEGATLDHSRHRIATLSDISLRQIGASAHLVDISQPTRSDWRQQGDLLEDLRISGRSSVSVVEISEDLVGKPGTLTGNSTRRTRKTVSTDVYSWQRRTSRMGASASYRGRGEVKREKEENKRCSDHVLQHPLSDQLSAVPAKGYDDPRALLDGSRLFNL